MKNPKLFIVAIILSLVLWRVAKAEDTKQSPPLEALAIGRPIDCGKLHEHIEILRKIWEMDARLMNKKLYHPQFKKDWQQLQYYQDFFLLVGCRTL